MKDLTKGNVSKTIINFALPVFIGYLFNLAYNLVDTRVIGSYIGNDALAAVGSVSTLNDLITGFLVGISNGFGVVTARFFGENRKEDVKKSFSLSLLLGVLTAALIMLFTITNLDGILHLLRVDSAHVLWSKAYIKIILTGLIFSVMYNLLVAGLRAIGDSYTPLVFLILSAVMNGVLDVYFVGHLEKGVEGAATATVISQIVAMVLCLVYTEIRYPILRSKITDFIPEGKYISQLIPAGLSMGLMNSLVNFGTVALQSAINNLGTNIVVAHAAARKLTGLFMMPHTALCTSMATFAGQNYGAGRKDRIKEGLFKTLLWSYIWCACVQVMAYTICPYLIVAITDTKIQEVIDTACLYQRVDTLFYAIVPTISIIRNSLQGMGDHTTPIFSSTLELMGKCAFAFLLAPVMGYWAIIWAEPVVWIIMVIPLIISMYKKLCVKENRPL